MRALICIITILLAVSMSSLAAQEHGSWREFRSDADGFSVELPGSPKVTSEDLGEGQTQRFFAVENGSETYMASVIQLKPGRVPATPDQAYFDVLMKAYTDGSNTKLRSSRMFMWAGRTAIEGISDSDAGTHLIDMTAVGNRIYLVVYAGAKGSENEPKAKRLRESFKLLVN
jgi:hypothetical protein